jgi:hypothetical protein
MGPETDIETRSYIDRRRSRASRAPWDPPNPPAKPSALRRRAPGDERKDEPAVLGGYYADLGRGVD